MKIKSFQDLLVYEMRDLYDAEQRITKALPDMINAASSVELRMLFKEHLEVTKTHIARLEEAFGMLGENVKTGTSSGLKGLVGEGEDLISENADPAVKDAGLIVAAQKVEHYEIAAYGSVRTWAKQLGNERVAQLFEQTLQEEKDADKSLTSLAERTVNAEAQNPVAN